MQIFTNNRLVTAGLAFGLVVAAYNVKQTRELFFARGWFS